MLDKLLPITRGLNRRFSGGDDPFEIAARRDAAAGLRLRLAGPEDLPAITSLYAEARAWLAAQGVLDRWATPIPTEHLADRIARRELYVALERDEIVGAFSLQCADPEVWGKQPDDAGYVHGLAIRSAWHGQGLGARLLEAAGRLIAAEGRAYLRLDCWTGNPRLVRYYADLGFTPRGTVTSPAEGDEPEFTVQRYERRAARS